MAGPRPKLRLAFARPIQWRVPWWRQPFLLAMIVVALAGPALLLSYTPLRIRSAERDLAAGDWTAAAELRARCERAEDAIARLVRNPNAAVRRRAVNLFCEPLSVRAERALAERVSDGDAIVASGATVELIRYARSEAVRRLAAERAAADPRPSVRRASVGAAWETHGPGLGAVLEAAYAREDAIGRTLLLDLCLRNPRREALGVARLASADPDESLRERGDLLLRSLPPAPEP